MNVVAEMKRTDRDKDWPFITSLGTEMLRERDPRGWLHLYDSDLIFESLEEFSIPEQTIKVRPLLQLAVNRDARLRAALHAERLFWQELDRLRIRIYRAALRPVRARYGAGAHFRAGLVARATCDPPRHR